MSKGFKIFLMVGVGLPIALALGLLANFQLAEALLRVRRGDELLQSVKPKIPPVKSALFLATAKPAQDRPRVRKLLTSLGITEKTLLGLPDDHPSAIPLSWIQRANPYPPLLAEYHPGYEKVFGFFSFGYIGRDGRYHQLTHYYGETDTTPSPLTKKARGEKTGWGDYYAEYVFLLSRGTPEEGSLGRESAGEPQLDRAEWATYLGPGSDRREELFFTVVASPIEALLLVAVWAAWHRRRR